ncbi:DUF5054 domain-containing protein [Cohnella silvisoli]|uniref:DUF5054 domain-containing protein n=1 Tax=Cohnella silvisoli TaxID=2873699 RepID=A0ABV1KVK9_9BACL|nr:DUF5054 domain-containing protein [Cohnella silvisoli]MCD9023540.1 DUF5054 domain-containing protein [Cohnella silvisoli]
MNSNQTTIKTVHVIFKTHLDIGFTNLAENVLETYVNQFIPNAIAFANQLEQAGGRERFIWTTGSWLIDYYLRTASQENKIRMEEAIRKGLIAWHAYPFTTHTELMDKRLLEYGLSISEKLDERFGKKTIAAKMTDVPGHTIGMVPSMAKAGIKFFHIGVNPLSKMPDVPPTFVWQAQDGSEIIVGYNDHYGDVVNNEMDNTYKGASMIPGLEDAIVIALTGDNIGPPSIEEIKTLFANLEKQYPGAVIKSSTMDAYAEKLWEVKHKLPVMKEEIGDTWIYGVSSDPLKISKYRELLRLRDKWIEEGTLLIHSEEYDSFSEALALIPEHTWGFDFRQYLPDYMNYSKDQFAKARSEDHFTEGRTQKMYAYATTYPMFYGPDTFSYSHIERSWDEQRAYITQAINSLDERKQIEAHSALEKFKPKETNHQGNHKIEIHETVTLGKFQVAFQNDGSIGWLSDSTGKVWADQSSPIGAYSYQTFGLNDYMNFIRAYCTHWQEWGHFACVDICKIGIDYAVPTPENKTFKPLLESILLEKLEEIDRIHVNLRMDDKASVVQGAPRRLQIKYSFYHHKSEIDIELKWFNKDAHRLPEASWFSISPKVNNANLWKMDKLGSLISPLEIVKDGNRSFHAINTGLYYDGADGRVALKTLDAPVVSMGKANILNFDNTFADMSGGLHFNLHNNLWATNFRSWYEEDSLFRFSLVLNSIAYD